MTQHEYRTMTLAQMKAKKWRLARPVRTSVGEAPAGSPCEIVWKRGGLHLDIRGCECCGFKLFVRGAGPGSVEEVKEPTAVARVQKL